MLSTRSLKREAGIMRPQGYSVLLIGLRSCTHGEALRHSVPDSDTLVSSAMHLDEGVKSSVEVDGCLVASEPGSQTAVPARRMRQVLVVSSVASSVAPALGRQALAE